VKRLIAATAGAALAMAGLAGGSVASAATGSADTLAKSISWKTCSGTLGSTYGALCGFLSVPLDYAHPNGKKIKLAVSVVKHKSTAKYQGVLLTNPGGPGGSGLSLSVLGSWVPNNAADGFDVVGFDPRGVGSSQPAIKCDTTYFNGPRPSYNPTTKKLEKTWLARSKGYAAACAKNDKIGLLKHLKTTDTVADMESIRKAFGQSKINYFGFSYGTYLGQVYATLHPSRVGRFVLDSNVDARKVWYQANLDQDIAFEKNIKIWFAWLAKYNSVYKLGSTEKAVEKLWYAKKAALAKKPVGTTVKIGADEFNDIFLWAGYYQFTWTELGSVFADYVNKGDISGLVSEYIGNTSSADDGGVGTDNGFAVYNGVQCSDVQWPKSWAQWKKDNTRVNKIAPFETWGNAWYNAPCLYWPAKAGKPVKVNGKKVPPILLVDETNDAATPYAGSVYTRSIFPKSVLLAEPGGTTHAGTLYGNACVDDTIATYLASGSLPKRTGKAGYGADKICAPLPVPVPTTSSATLKALADTDSTTTTDEETIRDPERVHF
jgi:pimeloyl-ACP methyl ester carboxylesterase